LLSGKSPWWSNPRLPFEKIAFVFKDDAEKAHYDALLDNKNQTFELSFGKEKVWLNVDGFADIIDKT